jgi:hypothetical protein
MPKNVVYWKWEEAFMKYGFGDGDDSQTENVADFIRGFGYHVEINPNGMHNPSITSITQEGKECLTDNFRENGSGWQEWKIRGSIYKSRDLILKLNQEFPAPGSEPKISQPYHARVLVPNHLNNLDFSYRSSEYAPYVILAESDDLLTNEAIDKQWIKFRAQYSTDPDFGDFIDYLENTGTYICCNVNVTGIWSPPDET